MSWFGDLGGNAQLIGIALAMISSVIAIFLIRWFLSERQSPDDEIDTKELSAAPSSASSGNTDVRHSSRQSDTEMRIGRDGTGMDALSGDDGGSVIEKQACHRWSIKGLEPSSARMTLRFTAEQLADGFVIGRDDDQSDLAVYVDEVSRRHAVLRAFDGTLEIKDLGSSNGTWLGGEKIKPNMWRSLEVPVEVRFGPAKFRIEASA